MKNLNRIIKNNLLPILLLALTGCSPLADPFDQDDPRTALMGKTVDQSHTASSSAAVPLEWFLANSSNISQQSGIPEPELMDLFLAGRVTISSDTLEIARQNCTDCNGLVEITLEDLH